MAQAQKSFSVAVSRDELQGRIRAVRDALAGVDAAMTALDEAVADLNRAHINIDIIPEQTA